MYIENVTRPTITIYPPPDKTAATPAVIVYPGGGFNVLAIDIEGTEICDWLISNGIACALLKYRVPCEHQGPYRECASAHVDAQRAMSIVRSRAAEWRIDPNRIGVIGFSAGAHMAIMASTRFDRLYPAVDEADETSSVLASTLDEPVDLTPAEEEALIESLTAIRSGNFISSEDLLRHLRSRGR